MPWVFPSDDGKVIVAKSRNVDDATTVICTTRYGNVMASRGSIPVLRRSLLI